jgi:hypothetical protein
MDDRCKAFWYTHSLDEDTGPYRGPRHSSSSKISRGTLKVKKRADGSAIGGSGLGVILDGKGEVAGWWW